MRSTLTALLTVLSLACGAVVAGPAVHDPEAVATAPERAGDAADVVLAAVDVARHTFDDGEARYAVLGRDDVFADNLAGAALAGTGGPLLYTAAGESAAIRPEVRAELRRVLGPGASGCGAQSPVVYLLGGVAAISQDVEGTLRADGYCVVRFSGASRVETSVEVARHLRAAGASGEVLLARADDWADAATGGAYAAVSGTPVVVTPKGGLHPAVAAFLAERPGDRAVLLGGVAALSDDVRTQAGAVVTRVDRVFGGARDGTAAAIARGPWGAHDPVGAVLVNGYDAQGWAYALSGAVLAARAGAPQLYVTAQSLAPGTAEYLRTAHAGSITMVGTSAQIGSGVRDAAIALVPGSPPATPGGPGATPGGPDLLAPWTGPAPQSSLYAFIGGQDVPYPLASCTIPYVINPDGAPAHAQSDVEEALRRIGSVSGLQFRFEGLRTDDLPTWELEERRQQGYLGYDGYPPLLIAYATQEQFPILSGSADGVVGFGGPALSRDADGRTIWASGQVVIGTAFANEARGGFARHNHHGVIMLHELGHAIGLGHPAADGQMMSGVTSRTTFGDGDRYALTVLGDTCSAAA